MKSLKLLLITLVVFFSVQAYASEIDISKRLLDRNKLNILTQKSEVKSYLFDQAVIRRLNRWLVHDKIRDYVVNCQRGLRPFFKSEKIIGPLCYLLRQDDLSKRELRQGDLSKREQIFSIIERYSLEIALALKEISEDPRYSLDEQNRAYKLYAQFDKAGARTDDLRACFSKLLTYQYPADLSFEHDPFIVTSSCLASKFKHLTVNISKEFANHPGHLVSETGWLSGNKVQYLTKNDLSLDILKQIKSKLQLIPTLYPLNGKGSLQSFLAADTNEVFTEEEGFNNSATHFVWNQKSGIFKALLDGLNSARETIFIDIFFLGGSMGVSLAKHLIQLLNEKPNLKVLILRDQINHFGHEANMLPVFNYLLSYSIKNPSRLVILPANIKNHLSGLPSFISPLVSDDLLQNTGLQKHLALYGRAMSDHSKTIVIDGKSANPIAFVGSKNLTDESGAFCYDEVAQVNGPSAAIVQDDFYLDMKFALADVDYSQAPYNYRGDESYLELIAREGWSANSYKNGQPKDEMISNILKPFDLLDRDEEMTATKTKIAVQTSGDAILRTGMTNADSTRSNLVDEVVQLIKAAQNKIYIKDQYIFDRNVVLALIEAKKKANAEGRNLDIKVLLEPLAVATPQGMPNLLYLDRMKDVDIEIKWMITHPFKPFATGEAKNMSHEEIEALHDVSQELHMKTISADGKFVIVGSANKDQTTMYGAFREQQLDIYDAASAQAHDATLIEYWNNPQLSKEFDNFDFIVPENLKAADGKALTPKQFILLLRNVLSILFDWTTVY